VSEEERPVSEEERMLEQIERELVLPAAPSEVWEAVTGPGWLAEEVELELVPGGDALFSSETDAKSGWVEEAVAPGQEDATGHLVFWWSSGDEPASRVELWLEPEGEDATRLRIVEGRPLEVLDLVGIPMPNSDGARRGPAMLSLA
jgi:uncharacterized protein YndB with AHSA1/START domain